MSAYLLDWVNLVVRWFHVTAAIAWIGESFYFVMLDRSLHPPPAADAARGVAGELWSVHGGGFYHARKFVHTLGGLPPDLHWSKWKSYATWLSGAALFTLLYLLQPDLYLVDPSVAAWPAWQADLLAALFLITGWLFYDQLCRRLAARDGVLACAILGLTAVSSFAAVHVFSGRAAFLIVGAMLATIMSANVFFVIIPGQRAMVDALQRGALPDPKPGLRGRQRSVHNTYFTLPVVFAMLSNHYAFLTGARHAWLVLTVLMLSGALVRQFFVLWHSGKRAWPLPALGGALVLALVAWLAPTQSPVAGPGIRLAAVQPIINARCVPCHAAKPVLMNSAPQGVMLDTPERIVAAAPEIEAQAVRSHSMPLGNITRITDGERLMLGRWISGGALQ